jgi:hypothetical protein
LVAVARPVVARVAKWFGDLVSHYTGLCALRVPLQQASGPRAKTLSLPGYVQTNSYGCGAVAAVMVARYFKPHLEFGRVYEAVAPAPQTGAGRTRIVRALRACGLQVRAGHRFRFEDLCQAIDAGSPVLAVIHSPGADCRHWVVLYGYRRIPDKLYVANNGPPLVTSNQVARSAFERLWEPRGNGLICRVAR